MVDFQQRMVALKLGKDKADASRKFSKFFWVTPNEKKGQSELTTVLRMVFDPSNSYGQREAVVRYGVHEGLDRVNPLTGSRVYPGLALNVKHSICLNVVAEVYLGDGEHDWCECCRDATVLRGEQKGIPATNKKMLKDFGMFFGNFKQAIYLIFACIRRTTQAMIAEAEGDHVKAGMIRMTKTGKIVQPDDPEGAIWTDPIGLVRIKEFFCGGDGGNLYNLLTARSMSKTDYELQKGKSVSMADYLSQCPPKFPDPFDPEKGWDLEVHVGGKGIKRRYGFDACQPRPMKKADLALIKHDYPDVMSEVRPAGWDRIIPIDKVEEWMGHFAKLLLLKGHNIAMYPEDVKERYAYYVLTTLASVQRDLLGLRTHQAILLPNQVARQVASGSNEETAPAGGIAYSLDADDISGNISGDAPGENDEFDIEDDIPF